MVRSFLYICDFYRIKEVPLSDFVQYLEDEKISEINATTGKVIAIRPHVMIYPNSHYVTTKEKGKYSCLEYKTLSTKDNISLVEINLITGRSHQIRVQFASRGHALIGDTKYGDDKCNQEVRKKFGLKNQLLHAYRMEFPKLEGDLAELSGKVITAPLPKQFVKILEDVK
mgnify:CR=1 FL=1